MTRPNLRLPNRGLKFFRISLYLLHCFRKKVHKNHSMYLTGTVLCRHLGSRVCGRPKMIRREGTKESILVGEVVSK